MVETQKKLQKNAIESYKIVKKLYVKKMITNDLQREIKIVNKKEKEANFWLKEFEIKQIKKEREKQNRSVNIRNLMLK